MASITSTSYRSRDFATVKGIWWSVPYGDAAESFLADRLALPVNERGTAVYNPGTFWGRFERVINRSVDVLTLANATTAVGTTVTAENPTDFIRVNIGATIEGPGIPAATTVVAVTTGVDVADTLTLSNAATAAATVDLTVTNNVGDLDLNAIASPTGAPGAANPNPVISGRSFVSPLGRARVAAVAGSVLTLEYNGPRNSRQPQAALFTVGQELVAHDPTNEQIFDAEGDYNLAGPQFGATQGTVTAIDLVNNQITVSGVPTVAVGAYVAHRQVPAGLMAPQYVYDSQQFTSAIDNERIGLFQKGYYFKEMVHFRNSPELRKVFPDLQPRGATSSFVS